MVTSSSSSASTDPQNLIPPAAPAIPSAPSSSSASVQLADRHAGIVRRITAWAEADDNIRALVVTGSSSREMGAADRFSDRDIEIIARDCVPLLAGDAWLHAIAPVWVSQYLENDGFFDTRLVFFEGARKVDFTIADRSRLDSMIGSGQLDGLYERGYRVLMDKDGLASRLPSPTGASPLHALPSAAGFADVVSEFWFEAAHMPTYLAREEFWVVKFRDWTMKEMLLRMLEWHALTIQGVETDVWYIGTKMKRWVDAPTWVELQHVFGRFDRDDSWRALVAMIDLFTRLTHDVAAACSFEVPESERHVRAYVLGSAENPELP
jgi:aminoglycoside 6-adenylyltransferase